MRGCAQLGLVWLRLLPARRVLGSARVPAPCCWGGHPGTAYPLTALTAFTKTSDSSLRSTSPMPDTDTAWWSSS